MQPAKFGTDRMTLWRKFSSRMKGKKKKKPCKNFTKDDNCFYESCQGSVGKGLKMRQNKRGKGMAQ